ncbi:siderophore-interacting protein [Glaciihabitans sp. dw_435]|uniref:siderophore-interacting protein n=1 Tax=Glaciihabitans sp. dw_435 TaxID=2720081 RepID=UPI001BD4EEFE|nr:siderophore-interacting protein [Glaciihabitans sp. dw_435]
MLTSRDSSVVLDDRPAYRPYVARVSALRSLSPHFTRVTFTGDDFATFGTAGLDQRIKLLLPLPGIGLSDIGASDEKSLAEGDWYARWRALPEHLQNPFRTYTVRAIRPAQRELDVDFVSHGDGGPAARWLLGATVGDELVIVGPDSRSTGWAIGLDWHPGDATHLLLAGDETAAPAICSILESLPSGTHATAFIEVPTEEDFLPLTVAEGCRVVWLGRGDQAHGSRLDPAVRAWVDEHHALIMPTLEHAPQDLADVDVDTELLWDSPEVQANAPVAAGHDFYAWLAGEAGVIKLLRRFLVAETGIDRSRVAFMGYWRLGKAETQ